MQRFRFRLVAREPQLICGAEVARILTEINRLPRSRVARHGKSVDNAGPNSVERGQPESLMPDLSRFFRCLQT